MALQKPQPYDDDPLESANSFADHYQNLDSAAHLNMETPDSFLDSVPLNDEQQEHMRELVGLAQVQRDANCNNRLERLERSRRTRSRLQYLVECNNDGVPIEEIRPFEMVTYEMEGQNLMDHVGMMLQGVLPEYLGGAADLERATKQITVLEQDIADTQARILEDQQAGDWRDYGLLKRLYMFNDRERQYNGLKYIWECHFAKKAIGLACVYMQDTRHGHVQALNARLMENLELQNAKTTRALQGRPGRSSGGGGRRTYDADVEE